VAFAAALTLAASGAEADEGPFRLVWVRGARTESCSDGATIASGVSARLGRNAFSPSAPRSIEGFIQHEGGGWTAHIYVRDDSGKIAGSRDLSSEAPDCAPLEAAVTLAIALAIDPDAALRPAVSIPLVPSVPAQPPSSPPVPPVILPAPREAVCPRAIERPCISSSPSQNPKSAPLEHEAAAATLRGALAGGLLPAPSPGVALAADIPIYEAFRGSAGMIFLPEVHTTKGPYSFGLTAAWLGACAAWQSGRLGVLGCGKVLVGAIHSVVYASAQLEPTAPGDQPWVGAALSPAVHFRLIGPLLAEIGGDLVLPITRQKFTVGGQPGDVYNESPFAGVGFVGLGMSIP
jgi:hypothetical protein